MNRLNCSMLTAHLTIKYGRRLSGRGKFLVTLLRNTITRRFAVEELSKMTIAYVGWILHELSDRPYKRMICVEPRLMNIEK